MISAQGGLVKRNPPCALDGFLKIPAPHKLGRCRMTRFILLTILLAYAQTAYAQQSNTPHWLGQPFVDKSGVEQIQGPREFVQSVINRSNERPVLVVFWDDSTYIVPHLAVFEKVMLEFKNRLEHVYLRLPMSSQKPDGTLKIDGSKATVSSEAFRLGVLFGSGSPGYPSVVAYHNHQIVAHTVIAVNFDDNHLRAAMRAFCDEVIQKTQQQGGFTPRP